MHRVAFPIQRVTNKSLIKDAVLKGCSSIYVDNQLQNGMSCCVPLVKNRRVRDCQGYDGNNTEYQLHYLNVAQV